MKGAAIALATLVPLLVFFLAADPFKTLWSHESFYPDPQHNPLRVGLNKGYVTVENFKTQVRKGHTYNAFIFGSSISIYYDAHEWARLLNADSTSVSPYHFDSSNESIQEMADKVEYLDRTGHRIDYALVILDPIIMSLDPDPDSPARIPHPHISGSILDRLRFDYLFFRASTNADFLKSYLPSHLLGRPLDNGRNPVFEPQPIVYDATVNQESLPLWDSIISTSPELFYARHPLLPSPPSVSESPAILTQEKREALEKIAAIFRHHGTNYKVIVGPNRRKISLSGSDLRRLQSVFGTDKVYDFSRDMAPELEADTLLYDNTHYRPVFALRLMQAAYLPAAR